MPTAHSSKQLLSLSYLYESSVFMYGWWWTYVSYAEGECILYAIMPECACLNQYSSLALIIHTNTLLYNGRGNYALLGCVYIIKSLYIYPLPWATGAITCLPLQVEQCLPCNSVDHCLSRIVEIFAYCTTTDTCLGCGSEVCTASRKAWGFQTPKHSSKPVRGLCTSR